MRLALPLFILTFFAACGNNNEPPENVLQPPQMRSVMYDMLRSGEFLAGYVLYKDTGINRLAESMKWYHKVWEIHEVTEQEFRESYDWYKAHPQWMTQILDSIIARPAPVDSTSAASNRVINADTTGVRDSGRTRLLLPAARERLDSLRRLRRAEQDN